MMLTTIILCLVLCLEPTPSQATCGEPTDVIFMLDDSVNVGEENFRNLIYFVGNVTQSINFAQSNIQIGMMTYSSDSDLMFHLNKYSDKFEMLEAIGNTPYRGGSKSYSGSALYYVRRVMMVSLHGRRYGTKGVVIMFTSGPSSDYYSRIVREANALKATGVEVFIVGLGSSVVDRELTAIASDNEHKINLSGFADLSCSLLQQFVNEVGCQGNGPSDVPHPGYNCPQSIPRDQYLQVYNGVCYQFRVSYHKYQDIAMIDCQNNGGMLVMPKTNDINAYLQKELLDTYKERAPAWIGLSDIDNEGKHVWDDGSIPVYTNWAPGQGGQRQEDCTVLDPELGGQWRDEQCHSSSTIRGSRPYVCQYPLMTPDPVATLCPTQGQEIVSTKPITTTQATSIKTTQASTTSTTPTTTSTTSATTSTTAAQTSAAATLAPITTTPEQFLCKTLNCSIECGIDGFKIDINGCKLCECNVTSNPSTTTQALTTESPPTTQASTTTGAPTTTQAPSTTTKAPTTTTPTTTTTATTTTTTQAPTTTMQPTTVTTQAPSTSQASTTSTTTTTLATTKCPPFVCTKDCGLDGYKVNADGCSVCECDF